MSNDNSNVVVLDVLTRIDVPPERVFNGALEADLEKVVIMGYRKDGEEYFASSIADGGDILWLLEKFKKRLMELE